ncbi:SDR family NAD(P)-dependent oxidoreductase [Lederbergia wuyishanensis]|uniref:NAD(P)-dependent dehydrogenase (Short-subunit alcohol dehydrogenase family) n=1 Tax=Lederbergia wuyishanensis TaxID=1347903 RepID=A0ABU0D7Z6_9BACI|nr:SDR family NAD(P)-dependent oxidoreductase [Lederbergia wuyishanensis]MCJ8009325.1 SDR family NAD(P)-dependent oxidoreductase [Lederbergia wuyishanensis]MDQ0344541.1 NAD(P)-dependent dehydrogenase (short-subunit alcohol dehydrogenase family) [Lederbergia wuyishanensis]
MGKELTDSNWNLRGKYVVITGATSGIGLAAAKILASRGANLGIIARNETKAKEVVNQIEAQTNENIVVNVFIADMSSQQSIRKVASEILSNCPRVDVLINNAGALFENHQITVDDQEMTWAVNHLGPFLLTILLLERLKESAPARIITTSSHGHKMARKGIDFNDLHAEQLYKPMKKLMGGPTLRYGQTKLANIFFTSELAQQLKGTGVNTYCFDPGLVDTNFNQNNGRMARLTMAVMRLFSRTPEKGAETMVWLAETEEVSQQTGLYYADKKVESPTEIAKDRDIAKQLWEISEAQTLING